jgi:hypothetical protein
MDRLMAGPEVPADGLAVPVAELDPADALAVPVEPDPEILAVAPVDTGSETAVEPALLVVHCLSRPLPVQVTFGSFAVQTDCFFVELEQTDVEVVAAKTGATYGF